jgi:hypothetical protein
MVDSRSLRHSTVELNFVAASLETDPEVLVAVGPSVSQVVAPGVVG